MITHPGVHVLLSRSNLLVALALSLSVAPAPVFAQSFDLSSTAHSQPATVASGHGVSVLVDGRPMHVGSGSMLTPAESVAVQQVLAAGRQSLVLGAGGSAVGGSLLVNSATASSFVVPAGVTAIQNAATIGSLLVEGTFANSGRYFAVSNSLAVTNASINAQNIVNTRGALLSSVLPAGGLPGVAHPISRVDLNLIARESLQNAGTISSSGALNIASSNIHNDGEIKALGGDINVRGFASPNISITGNGTFAAPNGAINLNAGTGDIYAHFGNVVGAVNTFRNYARVGANAKDLTLGTIKIDGDPTFWNTGNIQITGDIQVQEALSILAGGDITTAAAVSLIQAQDGSGQGYPITFIAGADVTSLDSPTGPTAPVVVGAATNPISVNGPSASGGKIDFSASTAITIKADSTCADCSAGSIVMAAYSGTAGGSIDVSKASLSAVGNGAGADGDVLMFAGAASGLGIKTGGINVAHTGAATGSGNISLYTTQPETSDNSPMVFDPNGSVTSGNVFSPGANFQNTTVEIGAANATSQLIVQAGGNIETKGDLTALGANLQSNGGQVAIDGNATIQKGDFAVVGTSIIFAKTKTILGQTINLSSPDRSALSVEFDGVTLIASEGANFRSSTGTLTLSGANTAISQILGPSHFFSDTLITTSGPISLYAPDVIELTSPSVGSSLFGAVTATGIQWSNPSATGAGSIVNPFGDVVLSSNLTYNGKSLAVLAAGNIVAKPNVTSINLSSATGNGGSLTMIAGYDFSPYKSTDDPAEFDKPTQGSFIIDRPSGGGGSILMPTVSINTSSTSHDPTKNSAGEILMVGRIGATMGLISVNNLTAKSTTGTGGYVHVIGEGGIQAGTITNASARGNAIRLDAAEPTIVGGDIVVTNGNLSGSGMFVANATSRTLGAGVHVRGGISTTSSVLNAGNIEIRADRDVTIDGAVDTRGHQQNRTAGSLTGGSVFVASNYGYVTTHGVTTSALTTRNIYGFNADQFTAAGSAGNITLIGTRGVTVNGNLLANGASTTKSIDASGFGGRVTVQSGDPALTFGRTLVTGYISSAGGKASGLFSLTAGGGAVSLKGNTVQILGSSGGISVNSSYGIGNPFAAGGAISIQTSTSQPLTANFDLASAKATEVLYPGAAFSIGLPKPVNGTAGNLLSDPQSGAVTKADVPGGYVTQSQGCCGGKNVIITISGAPVVTSGPRQMVTPLASVQKWQAQHAPQTPLTTNGGTLSVGEFDLPQKFTVFNLPVGYELEVIGLSPVLTMPATPTIAGQIVFSPLVRHGGKMLVDFGAGSGNIAPTGAIKATGGAFVNGDSNLIISTTNANFKNYGLLTGKEIVFAHPIASALTVTNIGAAAGINATRAIVVSTDTSPNISFNFRANGSTFNSPVIVDDVQYSSQYDSLALSWAKNFTKTPTVNVTFALADQNAAPITGVFGGKVDEGTNISISTVPMTFNKTKILTPLEMQYSVELNSNNTVKVASIGKLTLDDGATLRSAKDMTITAPSLDLQGSVTLFAGKLSENDTGTGLVAASNIQSAGGIKITTTGAEGINFQGSNVYFQTAGKDLSITSAGGDVHFNEASHFIADGGRLIVTAKGEVTDIGINQYLARSTDVKTNTGGGIYFGSGVTSATAGSTAITQAFAKPANIVGGVNTTGVAVDTEHGVFWQKGNSNVTLSDPPGFTTVTMNGGVVVFESNGPTGNINLKGADITTYALKPIVDSAAPAACPEYVVDTDD